MSSKVALRKESVDRNSGTAWVQEFPELSLSARRAWIEILMGNLLLSTMMVALRKESVDRNFMLPINVMSVSAVALRKESVDRNFL